MEASASAVIVQLRGPPNVRASAAKARTTPPFCRRPPVDFKSERFQDPNRTVVVPFDRLKIAQIAEKPGVSSQHDTTGRPRCDGQTDEYAFDFLRTN
jgi:hypothetical protein